MDRKSASAALAANRLFPRRALAALRARFTLAPDDLLRDLVYRRLWASVLTSSFGAQIMMLALPLTAAVLLHATPTQMGALTTMELLPFVLFSLPSGVWLDRVRKLPVYIAGEITMALGAASVPLAWWMHQLSITWLYVVAFIIGMVNSSAGSAAQVVLTQVVERDRLVEANAKNALASSGADVAGPGLAGALIKLLGAPVALLFDAALLLLSAVILRGIRVGEKPPSGDSRFWPELKAGLRFVLHNRLLVVLASCAGGWQMCNNAAQVVNILFATRTLGLSEQSVGLSYVGLGCGTVLAALLGHRVSKFFGPGPSMTLGIGSCSLGWTLLAMAPVGRLGVAIFALNLMLFGLGAVLMFINFLALRQSVTPAPMLGRMTSTMRWLILIPAGPGALLGGWLGEHVGLRSALLFVGLGALVVSAVAWRHPVIRRVRELPKAELATS
ncbi:MAG: MFS transporter [Caulobacter sp.]|nr:MFS transporter [Vitreoscilla sp.]